MDPWVVSTSRFSSAPPPVFNLTIHAPSASLSGRRRNEAGPGSRAVEAAPRGGGCVASSSARLGSQGAEALRLPMARDGQGEGASGAGSKMADSSGGSHRVPGGQCVGCWTWWVGRSLKIDSPTHYGTAGAFFQTPSITLSYLGVPKSSAATPSLWTVQPKLGGWGGEDKPSLGRNSVHKGSEEGLMPSCRGAEASQGSSWTEAWGN